MFFPDQDKKTLFPLGGIICLFKYNIVLVGPSCNKKDTAFSLMN